MPEGFQVITAADFDDMSPNERAATIAAGVVTDSTVVPTEFLDRIVVTARRLSTDPGNAAGMPA